MVHEEPLLHRAPNHRREEGQLNNADFRQRAEVRLGELRMIRAHELCEPDRLKELEERIRELENFLEEPALSSVGRKKWASTIGMDWL